MLNHNTARGTYDECRKYYTSLSIWAKDTYARCEKLKSGK